MSAQDQFLLQVGGGLTYLHKRHRLTCTESAVLSALVLLDGPTGCHPAQETIAEVSGRPVETVRDGVRGLRRKGLIESIREERLDKHGRWFPRRNATYIFAEDIERALQFAAETIELKRRATPPRLIPTEPEGIDHLLAGDGVTQLIDAEPGRGRDPLTPEEELAVDVMTDNAVGLPRAQAIIFARAGMTPVDALFHCVVWRQDLEDTRVKGIGALIHRMRHGLPVRDLTETEMQSDLAVRHGGIIEELQWFRRDGKAEMPSILAENGAETLDSPLFSRFPALLDAARKW